MDESLFSDLSSKGFDDSSYGSAVVSSVIFLLIGSSSLDELEKSSLLLSD